MLPILPSLETDYIVADFNLPLVMNEVARRLGLLETFLRIAPDLINDEFFGSQYLLYFVIDENWKRFNTVDLQLVEEFAKILLAESDFE